MSKPRITVGQLISELQHLDQEAELISYDVYLVAEPKSPSKQQIKFWRWNSES